jgi:hypothetical protein
MFHLTGLHKYLTACAIWWGRTCSFGAWGRILPNIGPTDDQSYLTRFIKKILLTPIFPNIFIYYGNKFYY